MLERIQSDATLPWSATVGATANRADLALAPAPAAAEMREIAVAPAVQVQRTSLEADVLAAALLAFNKVREGFKAIERTDAELKELERLYEKLLPGYKALKEKMENPAAVHEALQAASEIDAFARKTAPVDVPQKASAPVEELQTSSERERTLARIEAALLKVSVLRNKLSAGRASAHEALLNINASVSGLNMARMQVTDDKAAEALASSACEAIMTNVRSVVVAQGNVSPDLVRLILN